MIKNSLAQTSYWHQSALFFGARARRLWVAIGVAGILAAPAAASAITTLSQGFTTNDKVVVGSIVSLHDHTTDVVDAATTANSSGILGVVIDDGNSLLSLSSGQSGQIQVATSGIAQVVVSDINGPIVAGDSITASPISGVGMKATSNAKVVGIAQDSLNNDNSSKQDYTDKSGHKHSVLLGQIPLLISVSYYFKQPDKTIIPSAVQNIANAFAGKAVNTLPILISVAIFVVTLIVVVSIIYSMIHSSIISVGRNPMSQSAIYRGLVQMSALVVGIMGVALASIYMILTRF